MILKTFGPRDPLPKGIILPQQTHESRLVEIKTGHEDISRTDGLWSKRENHFILGVRTADCAPVAFWNEEIYGILHCGWRGLCNGILEKLLRFEAWDLEFNSKSDLNIFVGPLLPTFEIQKDDCYKQLQESVGNDFFEEQKGKIYFHFLQALLSKLPQKATIQIDGRNTSKEKDLASWRRDKNSERNVIVIAEENNLLRFKK